MTTDRTPPLATFPAAEYERRIARTRTLMRERGLDGLLLFAQESLYYLTGYDTSGYVFFQCAVLPQSGPVTLLTRRPDVAQARDTSTIEDIRVWYNAEDADPAAELAAITVEKGLAGCRLGVELHTYGLTAGNWRDVERAFGGVATLVDASSLVRDQRLVKSEAELVHVRAAGRLADLAMEAAWRTAAPGRLSNECSRTAAISPRRCRSSTAARGPSTDAGSSAPSRSRRTTRCWSSSAPAIAATWPASSARS
jgi:Xaa-Pro dipeptidase